MAGSCIQTLAQPAAPVPPQAERRDHVVNRHGARVNDPWFWLREKDSPAVLDHLRAENAHTEAATRELAPFARTLYAEMLGRIQQSDLDVPVRRAGWLYYSRTVEGLQYPIHCRRKAPLDAAADAGPEEVLLDLNEMARGKRFVKVEAMRISDDSRWLLYTVDETGYRQYGLFRKNLATGRVEGPLAERVTSLQWAADNATIFFTTEHPVSKRSDTLWRLRAGAAPEQLFEEKDELFRIELSRTKDLRFLVLESHSTDTWETRLLDAAQPASASFRTVLPRRKGHKYAVEHRDGRLYIRTNRGAKDFRIVTAPLADPRPARWQPFVARRAGVLVQRLELFRDFAVVTEKSAGLVRFRVHRFADARWSPVAFDEPAYAAWAIDTPDFDSQTFRHAYQSLVTPPSFIDVAMASGASTLLKRQEVLGGYEPARYASERLWITARDGVRVPVSIVYRKDRVRDGSQPLWLTAYGSYGYGLQATFESWRLSLLDRGFAFAIAHVRGGDELGEAWHDAGMLMHKRNTFTDFIDVAEQLERDRWTNRTRLVIAGASAGGLLMGAVANLRPELFKAVHAAVPFVDLINTMMDASLPLTVGEYLEWGNPNQPAAFAYMRSYSPYDNLAKKAYPAMLVTTSYNDSQVMYWEPAKYVAKLRALKTDDRPLLLKTKMDPAGHGGASGRYDALADRAFELAWMLQQAGVGP